MGSLIRRITSESGRGYGVNIWELLPPGTVSAATLSTVAMVADLPWGPVNTVTEINTVAEFNATFCPDAFGAAEDYTAMRALLNKSFPAGMLVCRIAATSQVKAAKTFLDGASTPADSVTVTANHFGALGNNISVAWSENADDSTARDATVSIGTAYSVTYLAVATIVSSALVVTDPGDPYVTFTKASGATLVPAVIAATALTAGADGTAVAADYVGSTSSNVGIRQFYADAYKPSVLFVAECPSALIDTVNTGLEAYATETDKGMVVLCTVASQTVATAKTYVADYRDDRIVYCWPKVKTTNGFADDQAEITVDGNAFMAALIARTDPWISPGGPRNSAPYLTGITGLELETITAAEYDALNDKGIAPFRVVKDAIIVSKALTTSLTSGLEKIRRRRSFDYFIDSIAAFLEDFVEQPLDLTLSSRALGPITAGEIGQINSWLSDEKRKNHCASFAVDPFGSATQSDLDDGIWTIGVVIRTYADQDAIVLKASVGDSVTVEAA